jgi:transmembrane sensor
MYGSAVKVVQRVISKLSAREKTFTFLQEKYVCGGPEFTHHTERLLTMTDKEYLILFEKHQAGTATPEELARFQAYLATTELSNLPWEEALMGDEEDTRTSILRRLQQSTQPPRPKRRRWAGLLGLVAVLLVGLGYWGWQSPRPAPATATKATKPQPLAPGHNQATLTLADGRTVLLDQAHRGLLAQQGASQVQKTADGQLRYAAGAAGTTLLFNTVATPRGGQYQLTLPDGSLVWLNAASSLRFPVAFGGTERRVELIGEAYFEVAKDAKHPFKVAARGTEVTVVGTHFDVQAWASRHGPGPTGPLTCAKWMCSTP